MSLVLDGTAGVTFPASQTPSMTAYQGGVLTSGTAVASTSGTSIDFTGIPSWVKRITVMFNSVSTSGTSVPLLRVGNGSFVTTGYAQNIMQTVQGGATLGNASTTLSAITLAVNWAATYDFIGTLTITNITGNTWVVNGVLGSQQTIQGFYPTGFITLSSALDRVRISTVNGTDTFDAGSINILYE